MNIVYDDKRKKPILFVSKRFSTLKLPKKGNPLESRWIKMAESVVADAGDGNTVEKGTFSIRKGIMWVTLFIGPPQAGKLDAHIRTFPEPIYTN